MAELKPFSTIQPGESMLRVGIASLARSDLSNNIPLREQTKFTITVDTGEEISLIPGRVEDINFWPVAIVKVWEKSSRLATKEDVVCRQESFYNDTVMMGMRNGYPVDADVSEMPSGDNYLAAVFIAIVQGGKTHFFKCGENHRSFTPRNLIYEYGRVGAASVDGLVEQYDEIMKQFPKDDDPETHEDWQFRSWMIANAVIANFVFTGISQQA